MHNMPKAAEESGKATKSAIDLKKHSMDEKSKFTDKSQRLLLESKNKQEKREENENSLSAPSIEKMLPFEISSHHNQIKKELSNSSSMFGKEKQKETEVSNNTNCCCTIL